MRAHVDRDRSRGVHPHCGRFHEAHLSRSCGVLRRPEAADLDVAGDADTEVATLLTKLCLPTAKRLIAGEVECPVQGSSVVARVIDHPEVVAERELPSEVLETDLDRIHTDPPR